MEDKRIVEIDGVKIEVDLRTAKRIDTFKVGDNVKVLCKKYNDTFEVKPGIITDFANFKERPTIVVAVFNEGSWSSSPSIEFIHIYEGMEDKYEIVYTSDEDLRLTKDGVIEKFEREIAKKRNEAQDLENQLNYFIKHFVKGRSIDDSPVNED